MMNIQNNKTIRKSIKKTRGFTLIELLVVISVLAAIAGMTSVALDGYQQDAEEKLTRVEMQRIANAIRRFKEDTGYWPKKESAALDYKSSDAANFSFLFKIPTGISAWDIEYAIGWHGPYIDLAAIKTVIKDEFNRDADSNPFPQGCIDDIAGTPEKYPSATYIHSEAADDKRIDSLVDRFEKVRQDSSGNVKKRSEEYCVLTKKITNYKDSYGNFIRLWDIENISASPYLYDITYWSLNHDTCSSSTKTCIALRSFGASGIDNLDIDNSDGIEDSDDIIFVLQQNE